MCRATVVLIAVLTVVQAQNQVCQNANEICVPLKDCQAAKDKLQRGQLPTTCRFNGNTPIVCCPKEDEDDKLDKFEPICVKKCKEYSNKLKNVVVSGQQLIVNGEDAIHGEFPHMAALGFVNGDEINWGCGGTLISESFVLTAGHCLKHREYGLVQKVRMGDISLTNRSTTRQDFNIVNIIGHPDYNPPIVYNDIALLKLDRPATFTAYVKPACLNNQWDLNFKEEITATGWGLTEYLGRGSDILQKVALEKYTFEECWNEYKTNSRKFKLGLLSDSQVCYGSRKDKKDTCQGDSGGPLSLFSYKTKLSQVIGVTSFGKVCGIAAKPSVYINVVYFVPWIERNVWPQG